MKIALVAATFPKLSETFVLNQVTGLIDRGHDLTMFGNRPEAGKTHPDVESYGLLDRTHYWPANVPEALSRGGFKPRNLARAAQALMGPHYLFKPSIGDDVDPKDFDVIYCHFGHIGERARALRQLGVFNGKLAVVFHAHEITVLLNEKGENYYDQLFKEVDLLLPISNLWREKLIRLGAPPEKVVVHRMGIDVSTFEYRENLPSPDEPVRFVSIARLVEKKGIEYAIRALAHVKDQMPEHEYHIFGDGPLKDSLVALADELGVADVVKFRGWMAQDELIEAMDSAHALLTPSVTASNGDMEGLPVAIMEGMARGLPVISTIHSGIPELIVHEENGLLAEERDWETLGEQILRLATDPELAQRLAQNGRQSVLEQHDIHALNDRLVELLDGL